MVRSFFLRATCLGLFAAATFAAPASAAIMSVTGSVVPVIIPPPVSLLEGDFESSAAIHVFEEGVSTTIGPVVTNITIPGTYGPGAIAGGIIPMGTLLHSYFVHFDPVGTGYTSLSGSFTLEPDEVIIGIDILPLELDVGDPFFGTGLLTYPGGAITRGFDFLPTPTDTVTWSIIGPTVSMTLSAELGIDQMRILATTAPVPEPSTFALCFVALAALGASRAKSHAL